ncbi:MAG TPA: iron-containing alcohol dehydrogenase [Bacteroidetes bacterium]|nr:iron-containing alcohol dehydrogenase [Bacteroidota bacterium]
MAIENFTTYNPVKLHFGKGIVSGLGKSTAKYGKKVLLIYGKGSVKKYGYYNQVVEQLKSAGLEIVEYPGIKPNPVIEDVRMATDLGRRENIDVIVALGGGSVIDSAKIIAIAMASGYDGWDIMKYRVKPENAIPLLCVLTLAATGTEMNAGAVVQNHDTGEKIGFVNDLNFPKESFLDPAFTASVPKNYTVYGIVDLIAHALEFYFGEGEPPVIDAITFEIIKDAMHYGPGLLDNLENIDLRANIMLDATLALNGLTRYGKKNGDWGVHAIGHELSLLYDMPHGASLSIVYIAWLTLQKDRIPARIQNLGNHLFGLDTVNETIAALKTFFQSINAPVNLTDEGIGEDQKEIIINQLNKNEASGMHHQLNDEDRLEIVNTMFYQ